MTGETPIDTDAARQALEQVLREIDGASTVLSGEEPDTEDQQVDGPHDEVDEATELADLGREEAVLEEMRDRRTEVEAALARIEAGTYGSCADCGKAIEPARLDYRPEAARCLADQEAFEAAV